jgi:hypothetical protein
VVDTSDTTIEISLWRQHANQNFNKGDIFAFKNIKVSTYNNSKTLNTMENTLIIKDPDVVEKTELELHFNNNKSSESNFKALSNKQGDGKKSGEISFLNDVVNALDECDYMDKMPVFKVKAYIVGFNVQEKHYYHGCIECNKKMMDESKCHSCNKVQDTHNFIYSFSFRLKDSAGEEFVDIFGSLAEKITGMKCEDYKDMMNQSDELKQRKLQNEINFKQFYFLLKPKLNTFNNTTRKRIVVLKIDPIDTNAETNRLVDKIAQALTI